MQTSCWYSNATFVVALAALVGGCGGSRASAPPPRAGPKVMVPAVVTEKGYQRTREVFDAIPLGHPDRARYREALINHLVPLAIRCLDRGQDETAQEEFEEALSLFAPTEVYEGKISSPGLADLAQRFIKRYAPRGDERKVMLGMVVKLTLGGDGRRIKARFKKLADWTDETNILERGPTAAGARTINTLEHCAEHWPSSFVISELTRRYLKRVKFLMPIAAQHAKMGARSRFSALDLGGYLMVRAYLRVGEIAKARASLKKLPKPFDQDKVLGDLLDRLLAKDATARDYVQLSSFFWSREHEVGLEICRATVRRFPEDPEGYRCVGTLAATLELHILAQQALERAHQLKPADADIIRTLAKQQQRHLFQMVDGERLDEATSKLKSIERFHAKVAKSLNKPLEPGLGRVYQAVGHGLYVQGRVDEAGKLLKQALALELIPEAVVQLANIRMNTGKPMAAVELLVEVEKGPQMRAKSPAERLYWEGRLSLARGKALELAQRKEETRAEYARAAARWQMLTTLEVQVALKAEAYVHLAQVLYKLGEPARALDALDAAIDADSDRKETYADAIALLVTHGHLPEALDAYHRALGRGAVSEYLKSYCSFWVVGLARRAGLTPDPQAMRYIRTLKGSKWYTRLAGLLLGKTGYEKLLPHARSAGNRAELYYYEADRLLAAGKLEQAQALWRKVLETRMLGFYEYEMSRHNLTTGPPRIHTQPLDREGAAK